MSTKSYLVKWWGTDPGALGHREWVVRNGGREPRTWKQLRSYHKALRRAESRRVTVKLVRRRRWLDRAVMAVLALLWFYLTFSGST